MGPGTTLDGFWLKTTHKMSEPGILPSFLTAFAEHYVQSGRGGDTRTARKMQQQQTWD